MTAMCSLELDQEDRSPTMGNAWADVGILAAVFFIFLADVALPLGLGRVSAATGGGSSADPRSPAIAESQSSLSSSHMSGGNSMMANQAISYFIAK